MNKISHHVAGASRGCHGLWTYSGIHPMAEASSSRLVDIPLDVRVCVLTRIEREKADFFRCTEAIFADQRAAAPATHTMCAYDAAHGHGDRRSRWYDPGNIWTRDYAIHELVRCVLRVYLSFGVVSGMQLTPTGRRVVDRTPQSRRACMTSLHSTKSDSKVVVTMYRHPNQA